MFSHEDEPQRRRIHRAVVWRMRNLTEACHLTHAQFMQDFAGFFLPIIVKFSSLIAREQSDGLFCDAAIVGQRLQRSNDAVASKERDEPRHSGCEITRAAVQGTA